MKNARVYAVDGNAWFNRAGPRSIESLEILAHLLHSDLQAPGATVNKSDISDA